MAKEQQLLQRPVEKDTIVLNESIVQFKECLGLIELWKWESITGSSIILLKVDIKHFDRDELVKSLLNQVNVPESIKTTMKEEGDYFFLNFNFKVN